MNRNELSGFFTAFLSRPAIAVVAVCFMAGIACGCVSRDVTENDKAMMITVRDLNAIGQEFAVVEAKETWEKIQWFDGSGEIDYEYELYEGDSSVLYMACNVSLERKASDTWTTYKVQKLAFTKVYGEGAVEQPEGFKWGDESFFALLKNDQGNEVGNFFIGRKGKTVYTLTVVGLYFSDAELFEQMVGPKLELATQRNR